MQAELERTGSALHGGDCGTWGQRGSQLWGVFCPLPFTQKQLFHLATWEQTPREPLVVVKCRSNFVLQFKELKKQGRAGAFI